MNKYCPHVQNLSSRVFNIPDQVIDEIMLFKLFQHFMKGINNEEVFLGELTLRQMNEKYHLKGIWNLLFQILINV